MNASLAGLFLKFPAARLNQFASRILDCFERLSDNQIWFRSTENQNAAANLVLHLCGNVRQWVVSEEFR